MKPAGSSVPVVADMIMGAMGVSRADITNKGGKIIQVSAKQMPALRDQGGDGDRVEPTLVPRPCPLERALGEERDHPAADDGDGGDDQVDRETRRPRRRAGQVSGRVQVHGRVEGRERQQHQREDEVSPLAGAQQGDPDHGCHHGQEGDVQRPG